jgi:hypothetical protein
VLSQMIFDNPSNDTYFREIMSNLSIFLKKIILDIKNNKVSTCYENIIYGCLSMDWCKIECTAPVHCHWSNHVTHLFRLGIQMDAVSHEP